MESNGKYVDRNGNVVDTRLARLSGVNLARTVSTRSIADPPGNQNGTVRFHRSGYHHNPLSDHHQKLLSNFFAQTERWRLVNPAKWLSRNIVIRVKSGNA